MKEWSCNLECLRRILLPFWKLEYLQVVEQVGLGKITWVRILSFSRCLLLAE